MSRRPTAIQRPRLSLGETVEHADPSVRIVARHDLALGLVVDQHPRHANAELKIDELAIDPHLVGRADLLADAGRHAVDRDAAGDDHLFDLPSRGDAGLRQYLVQAL